ncbi:MAG: peptidase domain-containing ABC transporter [Saprospiraceae bacterium]|nr:peptidase domain-containing ABC transporter [Saprospiraceae bacterium]
MFPFFPQHDAMDCGPACLQMVAAYHGQRYTLEALREKSHLDKEGVSLAGIEMAATAIGMQSMPVSIPFRSSDDERPGLSDAPLPCIVHWRQEHFVVVFKMDRKYVHIADPAVGKRKLLHHDFLKNWSQGREEGLALLLEPGMEFFDNEPEKKQRKGLSFLLGYLKPHRKLLSQLFIGLIVGSIIQLLFPFLTQALVDIGIQNQDINFIWLILIGQLVLFGSQMVVRFIQNWITLHIGTRINVSIIGDFLLQMMGLPLRYFDTKLTGDLLQRIRDHERIEDFLTTASLGVLFSIFNLLLFGLVLLVYSPMIFLIFLAGAVLYVGWIFLFLKKREQVDYQRFQQLSENEGALIEIIQGMPEIKLQNSEEKRKIQWMEIQSRLFRANLRSLGIGQYQDAGAIFISQLKDILIIFLAAQAVVHGTMTLGMMLAVQYIVGMVNVPLQQMIGFIRQAQDAKISLDRMQEIHHQQKEENTAVTDLSELNDKAVLFKKVGFQYNALAPFALKNINLTIPEGKVTTIVGKSGSGKTTLLKLLLGFYEPSEGMIQIGNHNLSAIVPEQWRKYCGAVLQDGYLFSDTIQNNITESDPIGTTPDKKRLEQAIELAALEDFIANLPLGLQTKIGASGNGLSAGQKQRILIARAIYKNPGFLLFDEATNALDSQTEKQIQTNLEHFFKNRTVLIVAHRLSTVKNADQIIVLDQGEILEQGNHKELLAKEGAYYRLVKEQLEI